MVHVDILMHILRQFARGYLWVLKVFTKLYQLNGECLNGFIELIACHREREASSIGRVTRISACNGDGIAAQWNVCKAIVA